MRDLVKIIGFSTIIICLFLLASIAVTSLPFYYEDPCAGSVECIDPGLSLPTASIYGIVTNWILIGFAIFSIVLVVVKILREKKTVKRT